MSKTFKEFSEEVEALAFYPGREQGDLAGIVYTALGLTGEAGEFADKIKKILRDDQGEMSEETRCDLLLELGDVLWYLDRAAWQLHSSLGEVSELNVAKLKGRRRRGTLGGSGDGR